MTDADHAVVETVRRWESSGGHWRVVTRSGTSAAVGLFTCGGGEEMVRVTATRADLVELLGDPLQVDLERPAPAVPRGTSTSGSSRGGVCDAP
jgi:hypothetical protein